MTENFYDYINKKIDKKAQENEGIYVKKSTIPDAGNGVFAKRFIPKGEKIIRYRGRILNGDQVMIENNYVKDRLFQLRFSHDVKENLFIFNDGLASKINDNIKFEKYSAEDVTNYLERRQFKRHENTKLNCKFEVKKNRVYTIATQDIYKDEELFLDYGFNYWYQRLRSSGLL